MKLMDEKETIVAVVVPKDLLEHNTLEKKKGEKKGRKQEEKKKKIQNYTLL